jgi:hypothetical protein
MNLGLDQAKGKYIGVLESDDVVSDNAYSLLLEVAEESDADIVKGNIRFLSQEGCMEVETYRGFPYRKLIDPQNQLSILTAGISYWSGIYKREFLEENRIRFHETPGASYQDYSFYYLAVMCTEKMELIEDYIVNYRVDNTASSVHDPNKVFVICEECDHLRKEMDVRKLAEVYYDIEPLLRFEAYEWNYKRLLEYYKYPFMERFKKEFSALLHDGRIVRSLWDEDSYRRLEMLLDDPFSYYQKFARIQFDDMLDEYHRKLFRYSRKGIIEGLIGEGGIYIFGAGKTGALVFKLLENNGMNAADDIKGFLVSGKKEDESCFIGLQVFEVTELPGSERDRLVIIAVGKNNREMVKLILKENDYENVVIADDFFYEVFR